MNEQTPEFPVSRWLPLLAVIIFIGIAIRVIFASGFIPVDDAEFARIAARILDGSFSWETHEGPPVNPGRLGIVVPLVLLFALFGPSEAVMAVYPLALSLLTMLLVWAFAYKTFGARAGLIATAIWIFVPLDITFSSRVIPDPAVTAYALLGIFVVYSARLRRDLEVNELFLRGALAGLVFGAAWLCKASTVYLAPFCLIVLCFDLKREFHRYVYLWGGVAAGALLVFGSEMIYYAATTGDWLYRFFIIERNYQLYPEFFFNEGATWGYEVGTPYWKAIVKRLFLEGPQAFFLTRDVLYLPLFGLIAATYALYVRDSRFYFLALLFATLLFMFNFFSASLSSYQPLPLFFRYFHSLCFVSVVLVGGLLDRLTVSVWSQATRGPRPEALFWGLVLFFGIVVVAGWSTFRTARDRNTTWAAAERELAAIIQPSDRIYTDALSRAGLEFFWRYPATVDIVDIGEMQPDENVDCSGYVLINRSYINWLENNFGMWYTLAPFSLPPELREPPAQWEVSWTNGNAMLYRVQCLTESIDAASTEGVDEGRKG